MKSSLLLGALLLVLVTPYIASAYSGSDVNSLLAGYNVSSQLVASLKPVALNYSGDSYVALYSSSGSLYFLVNASSTPYSIVLNTTSIYGIIRNYTIKQSLASYNFTLLRASMQDYLGSGAASYNACLSETGLKSGLTCTLANGCEACQAVPGCSHALSAFGGPSQPFGLGIIQLGSLSAELNSSTAAFYSAINGINASNAQQKIAQINAAYSNISSVTRTLPTDSVFPTPSNVTNSEIAGCINYANVNVAPWYCSMSDYCAATNYSYTDLSGMQLMINGMGAIPVSSNQLLSYAANVSTKENVYIGPVLSSQRRAQLDAVLSSAVPGYGALVNGTASLLSHVNDTGLTGMLLALESTYRNATANYLSENFSRVNETLSLQYSSLSAYFVSINQSYSAALSFARNNTAKLLELQADNSQLSGQIASAALLQASINNELTAQRGVLNITSIAVEAKHVASMLSAYSAYSLSLVEFARWFDSGFIEAMASALGTSYSSSVALAPLFGSLLSLIIGLVLLLLLFLYRNYMHIRRKILNNERTRHNWSNVFRLAVALLVLYVVFTYVLLSYANSSAPFGAFSNAYAGAGSVVVALNNTPSSSLSQYTCASRLSAAITAAGKTPVVATFSNGICRVGNATGTVGGCLNYYATHNAPVIVLTNTNTSSVSLYSLYGTVLSLGGNESVMNACYASLLLS